MLIALSSSPGFCGEIHDAAAAGNLTKVKALLKDNPDLVFSKDMYGNTPLHWAAQLGHEDVAELLLASKAEVDAKNNRGWTPLHWAAYAGHKEVAELLLANKADVDAKNNDGLTPLGCAAAGRHDDLVQLLRPYDRAGAEATAWSKANVQGIASLEAFLGEFPNSKYAPEANRAISLHRDFDRASAAGTISAYRNFLTLFKSDAAEALSSLPHAPSAQLYWAARAEIEKLIISQIDKGGVGQRFCIKSVQPDDGLTGSITIVENRVIPGHLNFSITYPGDSLPFLFTINGLVPKLPLRGNRSIIRVIGNASIGPKATITAVEEGAIDGDGKEPLSFILLKPYGAVYLDGRGTVAVGGKRVSLPIPAVSQPKK